MTLALWVALLQFGTVASPSAAPTLRHFREDHLTGADYLRLSSTGRYDVVGREHMGIWTLDHGTWSARDDTWTFGSVKTKGATFTCRVVRLAARTFLVWSGKEAPGIEIAEVEVRADLDQDPKATPPYVFFEIPQATFDRETQKRYPFRYYPEMNREYPPAKRGQPVALDSAILARSISAGADQATALDPSKCFAAFAERRQGGHEWRSHPEVIRVREVRGVITNHVGGWPKGTRVVFQIFGPSARPVVRAAVTGPEGRFRFPGVPPGEYCFEASASGWDPVEGRLLVSSEHPKHARISLSLPLAN